MSDPRQIPTLTPRRHDFQDYLAGLCDRCQYPDNSIDAIHWQDG
ncbi:hypothetical protein [Pseudomonas sp. JUb52]|nr:hypothetical protein [Pseudomonas sp. JUb52]TCQ81602.1 hypothetical protein EC839_1269 [Pseudomonas sp. JUb52]